MVVEYLLQFLFHPLFFFCEEMLLYLLPCPIHVCFGEFRVKRDLFQRLTFFIFGHFMQDKLFFIFGHFMQDQLHIQCLQWSLSGCSYPATMVADNPSTTVCFLLVNLMFLYVGFGKETEPTYAFRSREITSQGY